jgi:hypothetical protein
MCKIYHTSNFQRHFVTEICEISKAIAGVLNMAVFHFEITAPHPHVKGCVLVNVCMMNFCCFPLTSLV